MKKKCKVFAVFMLFSLCLAGAFNNVYGLALTAPDNEATETKEVKQVTNDMVTGKIKKIIDNKGKRSLLIKDAKGNEYVFHINEFTVVMAFDELKVGDEVDIIFNGILTKSIPPQGNAIIVNGLKI